MLDKIAFGLAPGGELKLDTTICSEIGKHRQPVIINHVAQDEAYCGHPAPGLYSFQSYISMPIILADGSFFGTLCAIDPRPAKLNTPEIIGMFRLFADLIASHLTSSLRLTASQVSRTNEQATSALREQFIAGLGHDLRNPLAAISSSISLLERTPLTSKAQRVIGLMQKSVPRMTDLIDNVLDFARRRLGGGFVLDRDAMEPLVPVLLQIVAELASQLAGSHDRDRLRSS